MANTETRRSDKSCGIIYSIADFENWLDRSANHCLGMSGAQFESAFDSGSLPDGSAQDLASVLVLIRRIRATQGESATG